MSPRTCGEPCWSATRGGPGDPPVPRDPFIPNRANDRQSHPGRDTFTGVLNGPRNPPNYR